MCANVIDIARTHVCVFIIDSANEFVLQFCKSALLRLYKEILHQFIFVAQKSCEFVKKNNYICSNLA